MSRRVAARLAVALLLAAGLSPPPAAAAARANADPATCLAEIARTEQRLSLPAGLLLSIALAESGRRDDDSGRFAPWAWTLNVAGSGRVFNSADAAAAEAAAALARNSAFVDVGCMQIDLYHHPKAFGTLHAALDPATNVDYAARYLLDLRRSLGSWTAAIAAYHAGSTPGAEGATYLSRVLYYWHDRRPLPAATTAPRRRGFVLETVAQPLDLAAVLFARQDYPAALAHYRAALAARPDDGAARQGAAATMARIALGKAAGGDLDDALADMAVAVSLAPHDPLLRLDTALLFDRNGDRVAARQAYADFLSRFRPGSQVLAVPLETIRQRYVFLCGADQR